MYLVANTLRVLLDLKARGFAHLDVKVDNIVIGENLEPELIDLGSAGLISEGISRWTTTSIYAPPEVVAAT